MTAYLQTFITAVLVNPWEPPVTSRPYLAKRRRAARIILHYGPKSVFPTPRVWQDWEADSDDKVMNNTCSQFRLRVRTAECK